MEKMYFSLAPNKLDVEVVLKTRPKNILVSYALWSKQNGKYKLKNIIKRFWDNNYYPNVMLDSGAYSFRNDSQECSFLSLIAPIVNDVYYNSELSSEFNSYEDCLKYYIELINNYELDIYYYDGLNEKLLSSYPNLLDYLDYISINSEYIDYIVSLDDINSGQLSKDNWYVIKCFFENAIPTFHFGEDFGILDYYINNKAAYIGLGGLVAAKKRKIPFKDIISWINNCSLRCAGVKTHLFGCQDSRILNKVCISSADGASWIITPSKKYKKLNKSKFELACEEIRRKEI